MSGRWGQLELFEIPMRHGILWWKWVHNRHFSISSPGLSSTGLACPVHHFRLKLRSDSRWPEIPLHLLWTQLEQPPERIEFVPMPLSHTAQGFLLDFWSTSSPRPDTRTLVLPMLTWSPFPSMLVFQRISSSCSSSSDWEMIRSSAYMFSQGHPVWNSWGKASRTMMNSSGVRQEPCWTPTFTLNSSLWLQPTHTLLLAFSYMLCMSRTSHSSMSS